jgi:hypothetical protein
LIATYLRKVACAWRFMHCLVTIDRSDKSYAPTV